jgi:hypothetical protein
MTVIIALNYIAFSLALPYIDFLPHEKIPHFTPAYQSTFHFYIDNLPVLNSIKTPTTTTQTLPFSSILKLIISIPFRIFFHKVKSHTGIIGNEVADQVAKRGATNCSPPSIIPILKNPTKSAPKKILHRKMVNTLEKNWLVLSENRPFMKYLFKDYTHFSKYVGLGTSSLRYVNNLISEHLLIGSFLYKHKQRNSPACSFCLEEMEDAYHIVFKCPKYWEERKIFREKLQRNINQLDQFFNENMDQKSLKELENFLQKIMGKSNWPPLIGKNS